MAKKKLDLEVTENVEQVEAPDAMLEQLKAQHASEGIEIYKLSITKRNGKTLTGYYREPSYVTKKAAFKAFYSEEIKEVAIQAMGEVCLAGCWLAGDNLYMDESIRYEATLAISGIVNMEDNITLKKS